jgi:lambda repressor-like predicted transcriptional regulator
VRADLLDLESTMKTITFKGKKRTLAEWFRATGIPVSTLYSRMRAGYSVKDVLDPESGARKRLEGSKRGGETRARKLTFQGRTLSLADWARETDIPYRTLRARLEAGWPMKRVLTEALSDREVGNRFRARRISWRGRTMILREWADELGVHVETLRARLARMTVAKALGGLAAKG